VPVATRPATRPSHQLPPKRSDHPPGRVYVPVSKIGFTLPTLWRFPDFTEGLPQWKSATTAITPDGRAASQPPSAPECSCSPALTPAFGSKRTFDLPSKGPLADICPPNYWRLDWLRFKGLTFSPSGVFAEQIRSRPRALA
jgi:hypothetical protein